MNVNEPLAVILLTLFFLKAALVPAYLPLLHLRRFAFLLLHAITRPIPKWRRRLPTSNDASQPRDPAACQVRIQEKIEALEIGEWFRAA